VHAVFNYFAKSVCARRDHRQAASERFQTGIGKRIVNCWQNKNVRGRVDAHKVEDFAEELDALCFVRALVSATGNEQAHVPVLTQLHRFDREK